MDHHLGPRNTSSRQEQSDNKRLDWHEPIRLITSMVSPGPNPDGTSKTGQKNIKTQYNRSTPCKGMHDGGVVT